ncbi:MAG: Fur family transcriptional regulator [Candidatus Saccharibacteria bacterium]
MSGRQVRWTKQLQAMIDIVYESENPLSADQIYQEARKSLPNISLGTVYRNLKKLELSGIVNETITNGVSVYFKHPFNNAHLECEICHRIVTVPVDIDVLAIERSIGMPVKKWNLTLVGKCKECERKCT